MLSHEKQIQEYEETIAKFKEQNLNNPLFSESELGKLEKKLAQLKKKVYSNLSPWERVPSAAILSVLEPSIISSISAMNSTRLQATVFSAMILRSFAALPRSGASNLC